MKRPGQKAGDKHQCLGNVHAQLFLKSFQGRSRKGTTFLEPLSHLGVTGTSVSALLTELLQTNKLEPPMMLKTVVHFWDPPGMSSLSLWHLLHQRGRLVGPSSPSGCGGSSWRNTPPGNQLVAAPLIVTPGSRPPSIRLTLLDCFGLQL